MRQRFLSRQRISATDNDENEEVVSHYPAGRGRTSLQFVAHTTLVTITTGLLAFTFCLALYATLSPQHHAHAVAVSLPLPQEDGQLYVVEAGDSLYEIALRFYGSGVLWPAIMNATNAKAAQDSSFSTISEAKFIRTGQKLWIPSQPNDYLQARAASQSTAPQPAQMMGGQPSVRFVSPRSGAVLTTSFAVVLEASGVTVEPAGEIHENAGHMHILVDEEFVPAGEVIINDDTHLHYGKGQLTTTLTLEPGVHVLRLQLANGAHMALDNAQLQDTITVTIGGAPDASTASSPGVRFVSPVDGAVVPPTFNVAMAASGVTVEPAGEIHENAGHMHILVDEEFVPAGEVIINDESHLHFGKGQLTTTLTLEPGVHLLRLQLANGAHMALADRQLQDTITITVAAETSTNAAGVRFVSPVDGDSVPTTFSVLMAADGLTVEPAGEIHENAGHMHILVDEEFVPAGEIIINDETHLHYGKGQLTTTLTLEPGVYVLRLQFANGAHMALAGDHLQDTITITVGEEAATPHATSKKVRFISPIDGATVTTTFPVQMEATGVTVEPAGEIHESAGHLHILIDEDFVPAGEVVINDETHLHYGKGQLTSTLTLTPGIHVLRLQLANGAHMALDDLQLQDTITVTVKRQ